VNGDERRLGSPSWWHRRTCSIYKIADKMIVGKQLDDHVVTE